MTTTLEKLMLERNTAASAQDNGDVAYGTGMGVASAPQPPPRITGSPSVHDELCKWLSDTHGIDTSAQVQSRTVDALLLVYRMRGEQALISRIAQDIQARKAFGLAKYGTNLTADNGRDHLVDAMHELLDALVYLHAHRMLTKGAAP
jgi:hypothetical protein